jgi:hypothetical protein
MMRILRVLRSTELSSLRLLFVAFEKYLLPAAASADRNKDATMTCTRDMPDWDFDCFTLSILLSSAD